MPRTENQLEQIRENKRSLIMKTALELFAHQGYYPTSISMIAQKAGISKGLVYNYFESKEDLIKEIIMEGVHQMEELFDPNHDGILTKDEFKYFINEIFRLLEENQNHWKLYFATAMQPKVFELIVDKVLEIMPKYMKILTEYYMRKGIRNPSAEALFFSAVMDGISLNFIMNPEQFPLEKMKKKMLEKFG